MLEISDHGFVQEAKSVLNIRSRRTLAKNSLNISCVGLVVASSYFMSLGFFICLKKILLTVSDQRDLIKN
jgi:hypothetical protein